MKRLSARYLLNYSTDELWELLYGDFILVFEDGEITTNHKETLYSSYFWNFHRNYPKTPMLMKHHVNTILKGRRLNSKTHLQMLGSVMWSSYFVYNDNPENYDKLAQLVRKTANVLYNDSIIRLEEYVSSLDILDFYEVMNHEDVKSILENEEGVDDETYINASYDALNKLLSHNTKLIHNPIVKGTQSGIIKRNQVLQCLGPRGYLTDIGSDRFKQPIKRGFVKGFRLFHDSLIESRSAAKSLYFSNEPLQKAEYFARRLQLLCQVIERLHHVDCGSTSYLIWKVKPPTFENGIQISQGDLVNIVGKYYLDETTNKLVAIKETDTFLYNKTLKLRSVIAGCSHQDSHGVCAVCFGQLSYSVPENTNLGHLCATSMTKKSSQMVLSVKHHDGSTVVVGIVISNSGTMFLEAAKDKKSYLLKHLEEDKNLRIVISGAEAIGLTDINLVDDVKVLSLPRVSEISAVTFVSKFEGYDEYIPVVVSLNNRKASLTYEFLEYIKTNGWEVDEKGNYVISIKDWDYSKPIMVLPEKDFNMSDHSADIAVMIESRVKELTERSKNNSPADTLVELFELVNSKLSVNLAVLEIILYAVMNVDGANHDYRLPKTWTTKGLGVASLTIPGRSLSAAMAFEDHQQTILDPASFFNENRPSHQMDCLLCPNEVINHISS